MKIYGIKNQISNCSHSVSEKGAKAFRVHCHDMYEILFIIKGGNNYTIEGESYHPVNHSILLMPPGVVHGIGANSTEVYDRYVTHINYANAKSGTQKLLDKIFSKERYYALKDASELTQAFEQLYAANELDSELFSTALDCVLLKIIMLLDKTESGKPGKKANNTLADIISYINENYISISSLDDITNKYFISKHHLNEIFKKATGVTVWEYIIRKRIYYATTLIQNGFTATESAEKSGFSDYSAFYKAYKIRKGKSPKSL